MKPEPQGWPMNLPPSGYKVCAACASRGCWACQIRRGVGVVRAHEKPRRVLSTQPAGLIEREPSHDDLRG